MEVDPVLAVDKPSFEIHPLGIGGKADPVRLVFNSRGNIDSLNAALMDFGNHFRWLINKRKHWKSRKNYQNVLSRESFGSRFRICTRRQKHGFWLVERITPVTVKISVQNSWKILRKWQELNLWLLIKTQKSVISRIAFAGTKLLSLNLQNHSNYEKNKL